MATSLIPGAGCPPSSPEHAQGGHQGRSVCAHIRAWSSALWVADKAGLLPSGDRRCLPRVEICQTCFYVDPPSLTEHLSLQFLLLLGGKCSTIQDSHVRPWCSEGPQLSCSAILTFSPWILLISGVQGPSLDLHELHDYDGMSVKGESERPIQGTF